MSLSTTPISSDNISERSTTDKLDTSIASPSVVKLRKIPPIPVRQRAEAAPEDADDGCDESEGGSSIVDASVLGLNRIRTHSAPLPLKSSNSLGTPSTRFGEAMDLSSRISPASLQPTPQMHVESDRVGKKVQWSQQSKSWRFPSQYSSEAEGSHAALAKEMQSPRFQAILRATSGKRRACDIKSFSHELNSKGVRPLPFWKSRAFGRSEVFTAMVRAKFDKLKEEVNSDLGIFAGDLVAILEGPPESHNGCKESLEDLLIVARKCAKMPPNEFWGKCEGIVQNLDDLRQELSMGMLKQVLTRLLFILTRCTRLVQFQKESSHEDEHLLASQQLSDLGVYSEGQYGLNDDLSDGRRLSQKVSDHHRGVVIAKQDLVDENNDIEVDNVEVNTAKSVASSTGSFRMSSWKKLPSAAEKNRKTHDKVDSPSKNKSDHSHFKGDIDAVDNLDTPVFQPEHSDESLKVRKVTWGAWDQQNVNYEDSFICRICEVEIPTVHVEQHSGICTIADRCDLKGLTVNERLERVVETLERILESWTPKISETGIESPGILRASPPGMIYDLDEPLPNTISLPHSFGEDMLDFSADTNKDCILEGCNVPEMAVIPDKGKMALSCGSLTPRSPLVTPRTSQVELLLNGRKTISEFESYPQISKLLDIARSVSNMNSSDYNTLEYMLERLEDLKYVIQDRKVDALVVETFGRRIEKLLQEKYVSLCGKIEDVKSESSNLIADDDSSMEDDTFRSLRASPINPCSKDRTSIEDFEIIKPISRGAFGRVFLARKRATGDLFAIKVLKKVDMIRKNAVESILSERDILISVRNPFVVRFFYSFTCRENLYLVMEYLNGGDLFSLLKVLGCLEEEMARTYIAELVLALEYLHSLNVIHRDLKPDNLLIGPDGHIKLTDFGLSKVGLINSTDDLSGPAVRDAAFCANNNTKVTEKSSTKRQERQKHSVVGTPDYLAPEILLGMGHGATADWWSVGVILFELLVGIPPFNADHPQQIFNNIMNRDIPWPKVPEEMSPEAYDLIDKLLIENPVQRLGATGAAEVKRHPFFKDINWDTLARNKAAFIPAAEPHDTSYFMSRYIWNPEDENIKGFGDFDEMSETGSASCSSSSYSNLQDEDDDECGNLADFSCPSLEVKYSFSNFSFKNLSQLASINYDLLIKNAKESLEAESRSLS